MMSIMIQRQHVQIGTVTNNERMHGIVGISHDITLL